MEKSRARLGRRLRSGVAWPSWSRLAILILPALAGLALLGGAQPRPASQPAAVPQYDHDGALLRPKDFYTWVFVGASIGLSYAKDAQSGPGQFHNVYTQPEAYREYLKTGKFPEKTMFVMPLYQPAQKVSINKQGYFEGDFADLDVSVKDHEHFPEGWAYFNFSDGQGKPVDRAKAFPKPMCYSCHSEHGEHNNVFTQFYPVLRNAAPPH
jgi:cytochrome P460